MISVRPRPSFVSTKTNERTEISPLSATASKIQATTPSVSLTPPKTFFQLAKIDFIICDLFDLKIPETKVGHTGIVSHLTKNPTHEVYYVFLLRCKFKKLLQENILPFDSKTQFELIEAIYANTKIASILQQRNKAEEMIAAVSKCLDEMAQAMIYKDQILMNGRVIFSKAKAETTTGFVPSYQIVSAQDIDCFVPF